MGPYASKDHALAKGVRRKMFPDSCNKGRDSRYSEIVRRVRAIKAALCPPKLTDMVASDPGFRRITLKSAATNADVGNGSRVHQFSSNALSTGQKIAAWE